ncbi:alpha-galactosidase [Streptomyces sp. NBC_01525]|uniref:hypothetical protein n=1 Tax=Streptomyces sp. NBC_01525 TaxID=2903893 RepID=UPI003863D754
MVHHPFQERQLADHRTRRPRRPHHLDRRLAPGETLHTPVFAGLCSASGYGGASRAWHTHVRTQALPEPERDRPVLSNSWEATGFAVDRATDHPDPDRLRTNHVAPSTGPATGSAPTTRVQAAESALGVSGGGGGPAAASFSIHPEGLHARAEQLHAYARTVAGHAADFRAKAAGASFV